MPITFLPGGGPDPWRAVLRRIVAYVRLSLEDTARAARAGAAEVRRRWPLVRGRIEALSGRIEHVARGAVRRVHIKQLARGALRRGGMEHLARGGLRRVRGLAAWVAAVAGRYSPTPRQVGVLGVVLLATGWILWERCGVAGCPDVGALTSYQPGGAPVLVDRHGAVFAELTPLEHRVVPLDSLPEHVGQAFIAVEDRRFHEHDGVDWRRVFGALLADLRAGELVEGSSTITMQLSRTLYPERIRREEKTFGRKLLEVRVAKEIEERFTKREILELYLNHVYFGGGAYGVEAASRHYFGKPAAELEVGEAALLAGLLKAPTHYDPRRHPDMARQRRDLVLTLMERQGYVLPERADAAREGGLAVVGEPRPYRDGEVRASYFIQRVRDLLEARLGEDLYARPLRIVTTLDPAAQGAAEEELATQLRAVERGRFGYMDAPRYEQGADPPDGGTRYLQGAVVVMDSRTGDVLAWVGGRDFEHSRYDRALLAKRQAGSAFKPFVYAAALERGVVPSQLILDAPYSFATSRARTWEPRNYGGGFRGHMSMREALIRSQNVPAVRLAAATGVDHVADLARRAGLGGEVPGTPVAALGVTAVSPLEMTAAYSAFSAGGTRVEPRFLLRVEDEDGRVLWESAPERTRVTDPGVAFILTDMLRDVVDRGTGTGVRGAGFYEAAAGKTGTTSDATDVWFVGYTPALVGTIWVGFDEVRPLPRRATGGGIAAPVWGRIMARVHRDRPPAHWPDAPENVVALRVDPETGMALEAECVPWGASPRYELFLTGTEPPASCPLDRRRGWLSRLSGWVDGGYDAWRTPELGGTPDPQLGAPRLPRRSDEPAGREEADWDEDRDEDRWERRDRRGRDRRDRDRDREAWPSRP